MSTLIRFALVLCGVFVVITGSTHLISRRQLADLGGLFTNPDGTPCEMPCLFGVRPGETPLEQSLTLLRAHPFTRDFRSNARSDVLTRGSMGIVVTYFISSRGISRIELFNHSPLSPMATWASLGQVIAFLGAPDSISVTTSFTTSYYRDDRIVFVHRRASSARLDVLEPFDSVGVYARPPSAEATASGLRPAKVVWCGFRSTAYCSDADQQSR